MKAINPKQICYIKTFVKTEEHQYKLIPERKNWWGKVITERVRWMGAFKYYNSVEEFLKAKSNFRVEEGKIYYKPHIEMYFSNGNRIIKYFESIDDMNDFMGDELSGINLKIIG
jgi:hypothetical protein